MKCLLQDTEGELTRNITMRLASGVGISTDSREQTLLAESSCSNF